MRGIEASARTDVPGVDATESARKRSRGQKADGRLFSGAKVARVLARLGVDFHAFVAEYDQENSRPARSTPLSESERAAVKRFLEHRQIRELAEDLQCSIASAHARVTRFVLESGRA